MHLPPSVACAHCCVCRRAFSDAAPSSARRGGDGDGSPASGNGDVDIDVDPVVHVWDTGIVLHSRALPPFLAPLARAVALAGQDISLMRKVRALVASSSDASLDFAEDKGTSMRWVLVRAPPYCI